MGNLITKLVLTGSNLTSDSLSITTTDILAVTNPTIPIARVPIATGSAQSVIPSNAKFSYVYMKVVSGTTSTDYVKISFDAASISKLRIGEFLFLPLYNAVAVTAEAFGGACVVEYGYWSV